MTRAERLALRQKHSKFLTISLPLLILGLLVTFITSSGSAQQNVIACYNSAGILERGKITVNKPIACAHPWDKRVTWTVSDIAQVPPTTPTTSSTTFVKGTTTTSKPVSTTTTATTTPSGGGNAPPLAGGFFQLSAPGTPFPTDQQCADKVHYSTWEPRPENNTANHTAPTNPGALANFSQWSSVWNQTYKPRIDGNFTGTTDEIIQYEACRWGWSDEIIRAEAVVESSWRQATVGDSGHSYGLLQIKYDFHPAGPVKGAVGSSWPNSQNSTAYAVDQQVAELRGCYDGMSTYLGNTKGDLYGCLQSWFSGSWTPGGGSYANQVKGYYNSKPWLSWNG